MNTVWRKVWRDLAHNKVRTALVVLSIAMGAFALDVIFLQAWVPVHMTFWGSPSDETLEEIVLREPGVADVEMMLWLAIAVLLSALSSLVPALQATRVSVREASGVRVTAKKS